MKIILRLGIDLLFIPLQPTTFNIHSEDIKKFIESAREKVPIMTVNQYPYNAIINNGVNGFLYESKEMFIEYLKNILENHMDRVPIAGLGAMELVDTFFSLPETETLPENLKTCTSNLIELINADY